MDWFLPPGLNFRAEGGVVTISATEPGLHEEFEAFQAQYPDPRINPMALNIPDRNNIRGKS